MKMVFGMMPLILALGLAPASAPAAARPAVATYDSVLADHAATLSDPHAATEAYLASVPADRREMTRNYARGNYIYEVVEFLFSSLLLWLVFLRSGLSAGIRNWARARTGSRALQTALYWILFAVALNVLQFPLSWWKAYRHEKDFGLLTQTFGAWFTDYCKGTGIALVLGAIGLMILYAVVSRARRTWWLSAWVVAMLLMLMLQVIAPVYLAPVFFKFTPVHDQALRGRILAMAVAHGVPAREVYEMNASRQTDRVGAYVNGIGSTMRIVIFDNTLRRCSPDLSLGVLGHEMGHYVLRHVWTGLGVVGMVLLAGLLFLKWAFRHMAPRFGVEGIQDVAGLPLVLLLFGLFNFFVGTRVDNNLTRLQERAADAFGLDAAGHPDAISRGYLMLGEYRDLDPAPLVEFWFYDHPSGRHRIQMAMDWKATHPQAQ